LSQAPGKVGKQFGGVQISTPEDYAVGTFSINPVTLPDVTCPSNLNSCTANDLSTTVVAVSILNDDVCSSLTDTIQLRITTAYATTATKRYDLGLFVSGDGGTVQEPSSALSCLGAAARVGQGDNDAYPDADTDLFLNLDGQVNDTCGDVSTAAGPVNWTVDATVRCNIVAGQLVIPSCRVWDQNGNTVCTSLTQAGSGSKCDCSDLVVTTQLSPCAVTICNDNNVCTVDTCVNNQGQAQCVFTPGNAGTVCRASAGQCDVAESCTGSSATCPADGFRASTTSCVGTSNGGACDGTDS
jgi:hypothetical protein